MAKGLPSYEKARPVHRGRRYNLLLIAAIATFWAASFYSLLVVVTNAQDILFPGNTVGVPLVDNLPGVEDSQNPEVADIQQRINILFLGLDVRRDDPPNMPGRTDSVLVMTVDPFAKTAGVMSIPRDLLVEIPTENGRGYIKDRINVAYEMGKYVYKNYKGGGPGLAKDTIQRNFGIPIDYYIVLDFNNFIKLIDEIGGVDINVPEYAFDPAYADCSQCDDYYTVQFFPGLQHMDGERALAYARIRHSDNDFKRIERQQLVMEAVAKKAMEKKLLLPNEAVRLYKRYKDAIDTDISDLKLPGLALLGRQVDVDNLQMVSLGPATSDCGWSCGGAAVLLPDWNKVNELKASLFADAKLTAEAATLDVRNGTNVPDLGAQFASFLRRQGVTGNSIAVDELLNGPLYKTTVILDLTGKSYTAKKVAEWLSVPATRIKKATDPEAQPFLQSQKDVIVLLGSDAGLPSAAGVAGQ